MFTLEQKIVADAQVLYAVAFIAADWRNEQGGLTHEQAAILFGLRPDEYNRITWGAPAEDPDGSWVDTLVEMARVIESPSAHDKLRLESVLRAQQGA